MIIPCCNDPFTNAMFSRMRTCYARLHLCLVHFLRPKYTYDRELRKAAGIRTDHLTRHLRLD